MTKGCRLALIALACALPLAAQAEEIVVSNYGVTANGMPYRGRDGEGLLQGAGRRRHRHPHRPTAAAPRCATCSGGNLAYGEVNPTATVIAIQQGADLKIVSDNVLTVAEFVWAVKPDSPIKTAQGPEGQEDRLHQSALDQPGARDPGAGEGRPEAGATPSW